MAKLALLCALFVLPTIAVAARPTRHPLLVTGKVYCDPCRAGFETSASTFIAGNAAAPGEISHFLFTVLLPSCEMAVVAPPALRTLDLLRIRRGYRS
ncbi:hypothetical protein SAY86_000223 [Trapa natans]|uniref:Uncharacterized protein n=1 Tax=Trapa natans TaxID=22666 RepID=A0AAN7M9U8_TRANT|nr:hypothetical protein SAY86_000223 [Trapa natans]